MALSAGCIILAASSAAPAQARNRIHPDLAEGGRLGQLREETPRPDASPPYISGLDFAIGSIIEFHPEK